MFPPRERWWKRSSTAAGFSASSQSPIGLASGLSRQRIVLRFLVGIFGFLRRLIRGCVGLRLGFGFCRRIVADLDAELAIDRELEIGRAVHHQLRGDRLDCRT